MELIHANAKNSIVRTGILAIDTSSEYLSLALEIDDKRYSFCEVVGNKQSQNIIKQIDALFEAAKILPEQVGTIAYIEGPGSFTGLRIGLSVALGMSYGLNARLIAIPAFSIFAMQVNCANKKVLVGLDARLGQIYLAGLYIDSLEYFLSPQLVYPNEINIAEDVTPAGTGFKIYEEQLSSKLKDGIKFEEKYPNATIMLDIIKMNKYPLILPKDANLSYLRNKVALNLNEQQQKKQF